MRVRLLSIRVFHWWSLMFWLVAGWVVTMSGRDSNNKGEIQSRPFPKTISSNAARLFDANNISVYIQNNGNFASDPMTGQSGFFFPSRIDGLENRQLGLIYTAGLLLAAQVDDSLRAIVNTYGSDCLPGAIGADGLPFGMADLAFRVYKIGLADSLPRQTDYLEWPAQYGAPVNPDGTPRHVGDQTLWCCFTDGYAYPIGHQNGQTLPLGAEIHLTVWGWYDLENSVFFQWQMINKSNATWRNAYVGIFGDCEIGSAQDDLAGSDSTLKLVYAYNGEPVDALYGSQTPAVGLTFLQTPMVHSPGDTAFAGVKAILNYRNLPAKAPLYYKHGLWETSDLWGEIHLQTRLGATQTYSRLQGLNEKQAPMINPVTGAKTNWGLSGDPVTATGWLDLQKEDRRFVLSSGPFDLAPGDTQTIVVAGVVGAGQNHLASITQLKQLTHRVHQIFDYDGLLQVTAKQVSQSAQNFTLPVQLINYHTPFQALEFTLNFDPHWFQLAGYELPLASRTCTVQWCELAAGQIQITITTPNGTAFIGNQPILQLTGALNPQTPEGIYPIMISGLKAFISPGQPRTLMALPGQVVVTSSPRSRSRLVYPPDDFLLEEPQITFSWRRMIPARTDSTYYRFYWLGESRPFYTTPDTFFHFNGSQIWQGNQTYRWTIAMTDGTQEWPAADTFALRTPDLARLEHIQLREELILFPENYYIQRLQIEGDRLYLLVHELAAGQVVHHRMYVYQLITPTQPMLLDYFEIPRDDFFKQLVIKNAIAYGLENFKLSLLDLQVAGKYQLIKEIEFSEPTRAFFIEKSQLSVLTEDRSNLWISGFDLSNPVTPRFQGKVTLPQPYYYQQAGVLGHYFYGLTQLKNRSDYVFNLFNITENYQIELLSQLRLPRAGISCAMDSGTVYVVVAGDGAAYWGFHTVDSLFIYDMTNPRLPSKRGSVALISQMYNQVALAQDFLTLTTDQFEIYNPKSIPPLAIAGFSRAVGYFKTWQGPWLYSMHDERMLRIFQLDFIPDSIEYPTPPADFKLYPGFPNPFRNGTQLRFYLATSQTVQIELFNVLGQKVRVLNPGKLEPGFHVFDWDGKDANGAVCVNGIYLAQLKAAPKGKSIKLVKLK